MTILFHVACLIAYWRLQVALHNCMRDKIVLLNCLWRAPYDVSSACYWACAVFITWEPHAPCFIDSTVHASFHGIVLASFLMYAHKINMIAQEIPPMYMLHSLVYSCLL